MALEVQEYLRAGGTLESLNEEFGIHAVHHFSDPLVSLKYHQWLSPRTHPIVRECRGLVLETGSWNVVAKPFNRFFNVGEIPEEDEAFDWDCFEATTKLDGSLILAYAYKGTWRVNTSHSFGWGTCGDSGKTWEKLFWDLAPFDPYKLDEQFTYLFELCSPHNVVVIHHEKPKVSLLSIFSNVSCGEVDQGNAWAEADYLLVDRPESFQFDSREAVNLYMETIPEDDLFEGLVLRDSNGMRLKMKTEKYLRLHHMLDNGNLFMAKNLIPLILSGEISEVVAKWPSVKSTADELAARLSDEFDGLSEAWYSARNEKDRRGFAKVAMSRSKFPGILFRHLDIYGKDGNTITLRNVWNSSADQIIKKLA
jgi:hypothetical protein